MNAAHLRICATPEWAAFVEDPCLPEDSCYLRTRAYLRYSAMARYWHVAPAQTYTWKTS
jgi:hypothetical protein